MMITAIIDGLSRLERNVTIISSFKTKSASSDPLLLFETLIYPYEIIMNYAFKIFFK
jgi:hypothetical protein